MKRLLFLFCLILMVAAACMQGCLPTGGQLPVINSFNASPPSISAGESSTLNWNVSGATTVSIDQGIGNVALTGNRTIAPSVTTTYTLTATNATGSVTATAQVIVLEAPTPSLTFAVTSVSVVVDYTSYTGPCPKTFDLIATITANGPGTVTYVWERSDGGTSPTQTLTFAGWFTNSPHRVAA